jgi:hypothetical protein
MAALKKRGETAIEHFVSQCQTPTVSPVVVGDAKICKTVSQVTRKGIRIKTVSPYKKGCRR